MAWRSTSARGLLDGRTRQLDGAVRLPGPAGGRGGGDQDVGVVLAERSP